MKKCPMCEGQGSVPDAFESDSQETRQRRSDNRFWSVQWLLAMLLMAYVVSQGVACERERLNHLSTPPSLEGAP